MNRLKAPPMPDISPLVAGSLALLSAGARYYRKPHNWVMAAPSPSYVPVTWQLAKHWTDETDEWVRFPGNPASGRLPRNYRTVGIINIDRNKLDEVQAAEGGAHAVAYRLGSATMVGVLPDGFGHETSNEGERYAVGLRIGRGVLLATAGIYRPEDSRLFIPHGGDDVALQNIHQVAISTVPPEIPVV